MLFCHSRIKVFSMSSQDTFGSEENRSGDMLDRLIWKTTQEQVGDGSAYRTAVVERKELRFLPKIVANNRKAFMALGVLAGLSGGVKAVDAMWPESTEQVAEDKKNDVNVASVSFDVHSQVCDQGIDDCYVDTGKGAKKISQK